MTGRFFLILFLISLSTCEKKPEELSFSTKPLIVRDLEAIRQRGYLEALVDNNSVSYFIYRGRPMGYEYELLQRLAARLKVELKIKVISGIEEVGIALQSVREETTCSCEDNATETPTSSADRSCDQDKRGFTISVALVDYMDMSPAERNDEKRKEERAKEFAMVLRKSWKFGQCNDDVVIFVTSGDDQVWTAVGQVAAAVLTPDLIQMVSKGAKKSFQKEEYTTGVLYMIDQYKLALLGQPLATEKPEHELPFGLPLWLLIVIAVVVILVVIAVVVVIIRCCCTTKSSYQMGRQTD